MSSTVNTLYQSYDFCTGSRFVPIWAKNSVTQGKKIADRSQLRIGPMYRVKEVLFPATSMFRTYPRTKTTRSRDECLVGACIPPFAYVWLDKELFFIWGLFPRFLITRAYTDLEVRSSTASLWRFLAHSCSPDFLLFSHIIRFQRVTLVLQACISIYSVFSMIISDRNNIYCILLWMYMYTVHCIFVLLDSLKQWQINN